GMTNGVRMEQGLCSRRLNLTPMGLGPGIHEFRTRSRGDRGGESVSASPRLCVLYRRRLQLVTPAKAGVHRAARTADAEAHGTAAAFGRPTERRYDGSRPSPGRRGGGVSPSSPRSAT